MSDNSDSIEGLHSRLRQVEDRQAIVDCLYRYSRGLDRLDEDMIRSVFHDDALYERAGFGFAGTVSEWLAEFLPRQSDIKASLHYVMNILLEVDNESAHGETYYVGVARKTDETVTLLGGRYVDRFERREGIWKIAARVVLREWQLAGLPGDAERLGGVLPGRRDTGDISYERPLRVAKAPMWPPAT